MMDESGNKMNESQAHFESDDELRPLHEELAQAMPMQPPADLAERVYGQTVHMLPQRRNVVGRIMPTWLTGPLAAAAAVLIAIGAAAWIGQPQEWQQQELWASIDQMVESMQPTADQIDQQIDSLQWAIEDMHLTLSEGNGGTNSSQTTIEEDLMLMDIEADVF